MNLQHAMRFPGGRKKAFTLSYDDCVTQDIPFIQMLRRLGLKATFNVNSGHLGQKDHIIREGKRVEHDHVSEAEFKSLYEGFEVALHTVSHPSLTMLDNAQALCQVIEDKAALERLTGYPVRGMAYPGGSYDARIIELLKLCGVRFCRVVETTGRFFPAQGGAGLAVQLPPLGSGKADSTLPFRVLGHAALAALGLGPFL